MNTSSDKKTYESPEPESSDWLDSVEDTMFALARNEIKPVNINEELERLGFSENNASMASVVVTLTDKLKDKNDELADLKRLISEVETHP